MNDLNKPCEDNLGGLFRFNFIPVDDAQSIAVTINGKVCEPVVLKTGKRWFECYATEGTQQLKEDMTESDHGDYYKVKLSAVIPKDRTEIADTLEKMKNKKFILDCTDNNGHRKLVGTISEPLRFTYTHDTAQNVPGRNQYVIEFYGDLQKNSPTYFI